MILKGKEHLHCCLSAQRKQLSVKQTQSVLQAAHVSPMCYYQFHNIAHVYALQAVLRDTEGTRGQHFGRGEVVGGG